MKPRSSTAALPLPGTRATMGLVLALALVLSLAGLADQTAEAAANPNSVADNRVQPEVSGPGVPRDRLPDSAGVTAAAEAELQALFGPEFYREDPHWQAGSCTACHLSPVSGRELHLRGDANTLCTICHSRGRASQEPHPVGSFSRDQVEIPAGFPLTPSGELSCLTCHDHRPACWGRERRERANFLRPAVSRPAGPEQPEQVDGPELLNFCYSCHRPEDVTAYNPHEKQVTATGQVEQRRCLFCHSQALDPTQAVQNREYQLRKEMSVICIGCHLLTPHAGAVEHLEQPPETVAAARLEAQRQHQVVLPLDEQERISCATCHNPHQAGVFPPGTPAGQRYDEEELPAGLIERYQKMVPSGPEDRVSRRNFRLGVPDFRRELRPISELKPEKNMRLPARNGTLCAACHGVGGIEK